MIDYKTIFDKVESTLISVGSTNRCSDEIRAALNKYRGLEGKTFSDAECYRKLVEVVFYAGYRAATVNDKLDVIHQHFSDYRAVARYDANKANTILSDSLMIRNRRKVEACIENARAIERIVKEYGTVQAYVDSFLPRDSFENLMLLKEELPFRFRGLGEITAYHVLTDLGLPVLKPDRVICRIFGRLGLIESDRQLLKTVIQGRKFAHATGHPIRYIDIVFVAYGQVRSEEFGLDSGICLKQRPRCKECGVTQYCNYVKRNVTVRE